MEVTVFGAAGRTGRLIVNALLREGHLVRAVLRRAGEVSGAAEVLRCDPVHDPLPERLGDAVVSAMASGRGNRACSALARGLATRAGLRFVTVAGAGVDVPGDDKVWAERRFGPLLARMVGEMITDRQREYAVLTLSELDWTMLRPPRLVDGPATGRARLSFDRPVSARITRADLADASVAALADAGLIRRAPFVAEARGRG